MKRKLEQQILDSMVKDPRNWRGMCYYNKKDPRLMVPKLNPMHGWTFNFANPYSFITLGAIILIIALFLFLNK